VGTAPREDGAVPLIRVRRAAVVPAAALVPLLDPGERARLDRAAPADRDAVASALLLARLAVAEACAVAPDAVRVRRRCARCGSAAHGVPVADRADSGPVPHLSLSRGGDLVVVALSGAGPVGVDVEPVRRAGAVPRAPAGDAPRARSHGLLRTWARTEAVLKAAGTGLSVDPRALRVSDAAGRPAVRVVDPAPAPALEPAPGTCWWLRDLDVGADHVAALAALLPPDAAPPLDVRPVPLA
jgi:4'-phosphopantetheinyl transferase